MHCSLLRTVQDKEALEAMTEYVKHLPSLVDTCGKEVLNHHALQRITDMLREKPAWHTGHLVAHFGYIEALKNENVMR